MHQNKILILLILLIPGAKYSRAQEFGGGVLCGIAAGQIHGDEKSHFRKAGAIGGVYVDYKFSEKSRLVIETYYIGKGAVCNEKRSDGTHYQLFKTSLHYIEFPFLFSYNLLPRFAMAGGPAFSYLIAHRISRYKKIIPPEDYQMNYFDLQLMAQMDFALSKKWTTGLRYAYSLTDCRKEPEAAWFNLNLSLVLKYKIK